MVHTLSDLGESINVMPLSFFKTLGLGESRLTTMVLQLTDGLFTHLEEIIEDVLIKVGKFIIPTEFFDLDFVEDK